MKWNSRHRAAVIRLSQRADASPIERERVCVKVYAGWGTDLLLRQDGWVLQHDLDTREVRLETDRLWVRISWLRAAAKFEDLRGLRPDRGVRSVGCTVCGEAGALRGITCGLCAGLGWYDERRLRVLIAGAPLSGRTTLAAALARRLKVSTSAPVFNAQRFDAGAPVVFQFRRQPAAPRDDDLRADPSPGSETDEEARFLAGVDVIVFVLDSQPDRQPANAATLERLRQTLVKLNRDPDRIPIVFAMTKRDLESAASEERLRRDFIAPLCRHVSCVAPRGAGVDEVLRNAAEVFVPDEPA